MERGTLVTVGSKDTSDINAEGESTTVVTVTTGTTEDSIALAKIPRKLVHVQSVGDPQLYATLGAVTTDQDEDRPDLLIATSKLSGGEALHKLRGTLLRIVRAQASLPGAGGD